MQTAAVPKPMRPGAFRGHEAGVVLLLLNRRLRSAQIAAVVSRDRLFGELGAVGWRVEPLGLLQDNGFGAFAGRRVSYQNVTRCADIWNAVPSPDLRRLRQQESRDGRRCAGHDGNVLVTVRFSDVSPSCHTGCDAEKNPSEVLAAQENCTCTADWLELMPQSLQAIWLDHVAHRPRPVLPGTHCGVKYGLTNSASPIGGKKSATMTLREASPNVAGLATCQAER